jgi:preprotein translocase SecE subunit
MYKWPQGRLVRSVCLLLTVLIGIDLGYHGAYGPLSVYFEGGTGAIAKNLAVGIFFCVLTFAALVTGLVAAGFHQRAVDFLIEVEEEMTKVEWPKGGALMKSTLIIAVAIVVMAVLILGVDFINISFLDFFRKMGGKL